MPMPRVFVKIIKFDTGARPYKLQNYNSCNHSYLSIKFQTSITGAILVSKYRTPCFLNYIGLEILAERTKALQNQ